MRTMKEYRYGTFLPKNGLFRPKKSAFQPKMYGTFPTSVTYYENSAPDSERK